jgi:ATP-binding cassette subfamily B multidrug efflux pump
VKELKAVHFYFIKYRILFISGIFFVITSNYFGLLPPAFIRNSIDILKENLQFYQLSTASYLHIEYKNYLFKQFIIYISFLIIFTSIIKGLLMFFMRQTLIVMSRKIEYDQKNQIYKKYQELNTAFYKKNNTGDLMSRISEDVSRVRMYFGPAIMYSINLLALFAMVIYTMFSINAYLSIYVLLPLPILSVLIYKVSAIINKKSEIISVSLSNITSTAQEIFSGIRVIQAFAMDKQIQNEFEIASEEYKQNNIDLAKTESFFAPLMLFLIGISTLMVVYIGGIEVKKGSFTAGNIAEFIYYVNMLTWPVASLGWAVSLIQRAAASQKRINQFLDAKDIIQYPEENIIDKINTIEFRNVSFTYQDTKIKALKNINLTINRGEKIAIIGKTGSGKSTITELLFRTYDTNTGALLINNQDIKNINLPAFRKQITYAPQDNFLFSDTIENNIKFANPNATTEDIIHYAQIACVHDDILYLPKQYQTIIGERGVMLSGGQKQRISIARCLIKNPEIIILDDCLSAVDANTEKKIIENLYATLQYKTAIFITHRIFAIMNFDRIVVLDDGEIVEQGTHQELMEKSGIYFDMYNLQQQEKENIS